MPEKTKPIGGRAGKTGGWELRQAVDRPGVLQLYVYGYVEPNGYDWWADEEIESETSAQHFREVLAQYPNATEIEVYINSLGGDVVEGTAIYNQLKRHPAHKTVYVDGFAASIASVIAMAGDEVVMPANTLMMVHNMSWGIYGNPAQLRKAADDLEVINDTGREAYLMKAGDKLSRERLIQMMDAETWLPARECVELGLADRIADEAADSGGAEDAPQQRGGAVMLAARAMGFDKLAARTKEAEERAELAEKKLQEAEKRAQEKATHETSESTAKTEGAQQCAQSEAEDTDKADGGDAGAGKAGLNLMAALCGLK
jgi:ATP-dependent protease ClpP protease subunit